MNFDPMNIKFNYKWHSDDLMIWATIFYHIQCSITILYEVAVRNVTGLAACNTIFGDFDSSLYFLISLIAVFGLCFLENSSSKNQRLISVLCIIPQQFILIVAMIGELVVIFSGKYADGYIPKGGSYFLFIDQLPSILLCITHAFVMLQKWKKIVV